MDVLCRFEATETLSSRFPSRHANKAAKDLDFSRPSPCLTTVRKGDAWRLPLSPVRSFWSGFASRNQSGAAEKLRRKGGRAVQLSLWWESSSRFPPITMRLHTVFHITQPTHKNSTKFVLLKNYYYDIQLYRNRYQNSSTPVSGPLSQYKNFTKQTDSGPAEFRVVLYSHY